MGISSHREAAKRSQSSTEDSAQYNTTPHRISTNELSLSELLGCVAHELRNPLTVITAYASLLEGHWDGLTPEEIRDIIRIISRNCHRMNGLITDCLDAARVEAGQTLSLSYSTFDFAVLCESVVRELRDQRNAKLNETQLIPIKLDDAYLNRGTVPTTISVEYPQGGVPIDADPDRLEQVLVNLLSNALKYCRGGEVTVRLQRNVQEVTLEVRDTGIGLTEDDMGHLFEKFYRSPAVRALGIPGTGLGLHLVKQIVMTHGGQIEVESELGKGTCFRVSLPRTWPNRQRPTFDF